MQRLLSGILICAAWAAVSGEEKAPKPAGEPVQIAVVRTLAELLAQPRIKLKDAKEREVSVRLGIEAHKADAGSGLLIHAVANSAAISEHSLDDLGPVIVKVRRGDAEELVACVQKLCRQSPEAPLYFFAKSIRLPIADRYRVQVFRPDSEDVLAEATIEVAAEPDGEPRWQKLDTDSAVANRNGDPPWAGSFTIGAHAVPKIPGEEAFPLYAATADGKFAGAERIALPKLLPSRPTIEEPVAPASALGRRIANLILELGNESYERREAATRTLGELGHRAGAALKEALVENEEPEIRNRALHLLRALEGPFTARLVGGAIHVSMPVPFDPTSLDEHLLARWWVNGKPLVSKTQRELELDRTGQVLLNRQAALAIDLRHTGIEPEDTLEVEFLYCPMGTEEMVSDIMLAQRERLAQEVNGEDLFQSLRCLRSNRLTFTASALKGVGR